MHFEWLILNNSLEVPQIALFGGGLLDIDDIQSQPLWSSS